MTTSGTYAFSVTRDDIITMALRSIRKLDEIELPTPQDTADCSRWLNMLVKQWQGRADYAPGLKTWMRRRGHLFLSNTTGQYILGPQGAGWTESYVTANMASTAVAGAITVTLNSSVGISLNNYIGVVLDSGALFWTSIVNLAGAVATLATGLPYAASVNELVFVYAITAQQPVKIESATLRDSSNQDVPIRIFESVQDYDALPSKTDPTFSTDPTAIYYEFQLGNSFLFTDAGSSSDVTKHIVLTYLEAAQDFNSPLDNPEYPQEWYLPLTLGLAKLAAPMYGAKWLQENEANYQQALAVAQRKDVEVVSYYFQPNEMP